MLSNITNHIKKPGIFRNILLQSYSGILKSYSKRYTQHLGRFNHIQNPGISRHIWIYYADSGMFGILTDIFIYIKAYSELMVYSGIFKTIDIFSQIQAYY